MKGWKDLDFKNIPSDFLQHGKYEFKVKVKEKDKSFIEDGTVFYDCGLEHVLSFRQGIYLYRLKPIEPIKVKFTF